MAAIEELPKLQELRTLVLKAFDLMYLKNLLSTPIGFRLRRLDLHFNYNFPGINLTEIVVLCPILSELAVCDSLVTTSNDQQATMLQGDQYGNALF